MADTTKTAADQSFFIFVKDTNTGRIRRIAIPGDVQIGLQGNPAELQLLGRLSLNAADYRVTGVNKGVIHATNDDTIIAISLVSPADTPTSGRITVFLPANPRNGQLHFIKDMTGTASTVPIDVIPSPGVKIDQFDFRTLDDPFGSFAFYWFGDRWRRLVAGVGVGGGGGAGPVDATYVTLSGNTTLTQDRRLNVSGTNLVMTDQGPNASVILDLSQILGGGAGTYTYATVTVDSFGRITAASNGANPPPANASYITVTNEPALTAERALVAGTGLFSTDGGANSSITLAINNNVVATISGSRFTGPVIAAGGLSGSLSQLSTGISYLIAGPGISIFTSSNGQITISSPWTDGGSTLLTTSSVSHDGQGRFASAIGTDVYFFVSGTIGIPSGGVNARRVAVFGGDVRVSGSLTVGTGSVTVTSNDIQFGGNGTRIERVGNDLKFFDSNNPTGQPLTNLVGGGGGGSGGTGTTINQTVISASNPGWITAFDVDFTTATPASFTTNGDHTLGGLPFVLENMANADSIATVAGVGLVIDPNATASDFFATVYTAPAAVLPINRSIPGFNLRDYEIRVWAIMEVTGSDANFEIADFGLTKYPQAAASTKYAVVAEKGFSNGSFTGYNALINATSIGGGTTVSAANCNAFMIQWRDLIDFDTYACNASVAQTFDQISGSLLLHGNWRGIGQSLAGAGQGIGPTSHAISGSGDLAITLLAKPVNTNNSFQATFRRLRLDYRLRGNTTNVLPVQVITGSSVVNYHDTTYTPLLGLWSLSGTLNDSSSFVSNLTCSAGNTRYVNMGPGLRGMFFDGSNILSLTASLPVALASAMTGAVTFEALCILEPPAAQNVLFACTGLTGDVNGSENSLFQVNINPNGTMEYGAEFNVGTNIGYGTTAALPFNRLFHLVVSRDTGGVIRTYVDGALIDTSGATTMPNTGSVALSSARFNFGFFPNTTFSNFSGGSLTNSSVASVKIVGRALTDGEVAAEYQRTLGNLYSQTTVVTQSINFNTFTSSTFAASGFQQANYAFVTSSNQWSVPAGSTFVGEPVLTASITTSGSPVFITVNANYTAQSGTPTGIFSLARNGVNLGHPVWGMKPSGPLQNSFNDNVSIQFVDFPPAGTYSYSFIGCNPTGSGFLTAYGVGPASILAFEMKGANVVTASSMTEVSVPGGNITGLSASITPTRGPVLAIASLTHAGDNAVNWAHGTIARNGNNLAGGTDEVLTVNTVSGEANCFNMMFLDQGATMGGSNTYNVQATQGAGTGKINKNNSLGTLILWELPDVNFKYATSTNTTALGGGYTDVVPSTPSLMLSTRGRPVLLGWAGNINTTSANGRSGWSFLRNGSAIASSSKGFQLVDGENNNDWNRVPSMFWLDVQPAGSYQYQIAGFNVSGSQSMNQTPAGLSAFFVYELDAGTNVLAGGWLDTGNVLQTTASVKVSGSFSAAGNYGTYAQRGNAGNVGRRFTASDALVAEWVDDGTAWHPILAGGVIGVEPPLTGTFNNGIGTAGSVLEQFSGSFRLTGVNEGANSFTRGFTKSFSATTAFVEALILPLPGPIVANQFPGTFIGMRESSSGKIYTFGTIVHGTNLITYAEAEVYTNPTTRTAATAWAIPAAVNQVYFRIRRDAANIYADISTDRKVWLNYETRTLTSVFTTAPDEIGVFSLGFSATPRATYSHFASGTL